MNYRLLQVGEKIEEGDQVYDFKSGWKAATGRYLGTEIRQLPQDCGFFARRLERRTFIEVMVPDTNRDDGFENGLSVEIIEGIIILDGGPECLHLPVSYAQALVDAIKEVAGL